MAVASGNAAVPPNGRRAMGNPDEPTDRTHGARAALPPSRAPCRLARFYQEDADNAGWGYGIGAKAPEGVEAMSKKHMGSSIDDFLKEEGILRRRKRKR